MDRSEHGLDLFSQHQHSSKHITFNESNLMQGKCKRRSKKDKIGRNFVCGCGKKYLSYPALYTHIRTKHEGKQPEGTKSFNNNKSKRGRPKKVEINEDITQFGGLDQITVPMPNDNAEINFLQNDLSNILQGEITLFELKNQLKTLKYFGKNSEGECNPYQYFTNLSNQSDKEWILQIFNKFENSNEIEGTHELETLFSQPNCDIAFSLFLFNLCKIVNSDIYRLFCILIQNLRKCLNKNGYEEKRKYMKKDCIQEEVLVFCEIERPFYIPIISNYFLLEYLPEKCKNFDQDIALMMLQDFNSWIYNKKMSKIKCKLKSSRLEEKIPLFIENTLKIK